MMAPITERCSQRSLVGMIGVCPQRPQVRTFALFRLKPRSSRNTTVAPSAIFFPQGLSLDTNPGGDVVVVAFHGPQRGPLIREPPAAQDSGEVRPIKPHAGGHADHVADLRDRPAAGFKAVRPGVTVNYGSDLVLLRSGQMLWSTSGAGRAQRVLSIAPQPSTPRTDGDLGHAELLGQVVGRAARVGEGRVGSQTPFFLLGAREVARPPEGNRQAPCYRFTHGSVSCLQGMAAS